MESASYNKLGLARLRFRQDEFPCFPHQPPNLDFLEPCGNRKRGYIEVPFRSSHEGRNLHREKVLAAICKWIRLIIIGVFWTVRGYGHGRPERKFRECAQDAIESQIVTGVA